MNEIWQDIERILARQFLILLDDFNPPCSSEELTFLQEVTKKCLKSLYDFYNVHDAQKSHDLAFWSPWRLLSVRHIKTNLKVVNEDLVAEWEQDGMLPTDEAEANGPVKPILWSSDWIPIASNGGGDLLCVDLSLDAGGQVGQIIVWWHETVLREVLYSSFSELMADYLRDLEANVFELIAGQGLTKP